VIGSRGSRILRVAALGAAFFFSGGRAIVAAAPATAIEPAVIEQYRTGYGPAILAQFAELLAIPNVAGHPEEIRRNADWLREALEKRGMAATLWSLPGASPVVYGALDVPGARRTLGIYAHYDGQPVDAAEWIQSPWEPALYTAAVEEGGIRRPFPAAGDLIDPEWRLYARSAGDDKAPIVALLAALDALGAAERRPSSNLRILFEGEEEAGSGHLGAYLESHRQELAVDLWLICDGPVHANRRPQLVFGVRGVTGLELTAYGATRHLHSGHYGNWAPNPAQLLASLLASMKDESGRVLIEDFYDSTVPATDADRQAMAALPDFDAELRHELGLAETEGAGASLAERLMIPSLNVRGLRGGAVGESASNVIPSEATASLDLRLAKGNDPEAMLDLVEAHIRSRGFWIVRDEPDLETRLTHPRIVRVRRQPGYPAARTPIGSPAVQPVIEAARRAAGEPPILVPTLGGSLPLYLFSEVLGQPVVIAPIANHDDNQHAPNENLRIANLWYGIDLMAQLLTMP
jgi:acetylornithine deacetylase/succinyl-diaminopimelate desuccinylase-like protein